MTAAEKLAQGLEELRRHNREKEEAARRARVTMPHGDIRTAARHNGQFERIYPQPTDGQGAAPR